MANLGFKAHDRKVVRCSKGQTPYGYQLKNGVIAVHKTEYQILEKIRLKKNNGESYGQIAAWLNTQNVTTKNGIGHWSRSTVFRILKSNWGDKIRCQERRIDK